MSASALSSCCYPLQTVTVLVKFLWLASMPAWNVACGSSRGTETKRYARRVKHAPCMHTALHNLAKQHTRAGYRQLCALGQDFRAMTAFMCPRLQQCTYSWMISSLHNFCTPVQHKMLSCAVQHSSERLCLMCAVSADSELCCVGDRICVSRHKGGDAIDRHSVAVGEPHHGCSRSPWYAFCPP